MIDYFIENSSTLEELETKTLKIIKSIPDNLDNPDN